MTASPAAQTGRVTVVISTFNRADFLPEAIESLLGQTVPPARIVVIDDGSTDGTAQAAGRFSDKVEYVLRPNGGKAKALNQIIPSVTTEFVWFFDDDDMAYPDALAQMLAAADRHKDDGFVFGDYDLAWATGPLLAADIKHRDGYAFAAESAAMQRLRLFRDCTVMMTGSLLRTSAVKSIGGFNEALLRCQDYDLMLRLAARYPFSHIGHRVYRWRQHDGTRGTGAAQHDNNSRLAAWAKFNEPIGEFLRSQVQLKDFTPTPDAPTGMAQARRQRLICRAWSTGPKLPLALAIADVLAAFEADPTSALTSFELDRLREIFNHPFVALRSTRPLYSLWQLAASAAARPGLVEIARGLYWSARGQTGTMDRVRWTALAACLASAGLAGKVMPSKSARATAQ